MALAGITKHADAVWMEQMARNAVDPDSGHLRSQRYILHDRDTKFCATFRSILESAGTKCRTLPPRSPNLNAYSERWVRSAKEECLCKLCLIFMVSATIKGKATFCCFRANSTKPTSHVIQRNPRLGGLLSNWRRPGRPRNDSDTPTPKVSLETGQTR